MKRRTHIHIAYICNIRYNIHIYIRIMLWLFIYDSKLFRILYLIMGEMVGQIIIIFCSNEFLILVGQTNLVLL